MRSGPAGSARLLVPCSITALAGACGGVAVAMAARGQVPAAIGLMVAAGILDAVDGPVARWMQATSRLGAWLDRAADFISFGVAPAVLMLAAFGREALPLQVASAGYGVACGLRLVLPGRRRADGFRGVPAPMAALLVLSPLVLGLAFPGVRVEPAVQAAVAVGVAGLMLAPIRTPAWREVFCRLRPGRLASASGLSAIAAGLVFAPWVALLGSAGVYLLLVAAWQFAPPGAAAATSANLHDQRGVRVFQ